MPTILTYRPQHPHIPADIIRGDTCDTWRSMNPLTGICSACTTVPGYIYASPNGEGNTRPFVHCSLYIVHWPSSAVQHLHYLPWGEDFVNQRTSSFSSMYTFSVKEKDSETGYSYFGARYYNSDLSIWLSVDPMSDKYPSMSPYVYCANNPVKLVDPNGEEPRTPTACMRDLSV